jgi:hypothetical protein
MSWRSVQGQCQALGTTSYKPTHSTNPANFLHPRLWTAQEAEAGDYFRVADED